MPARAFTRALLKYRARRYRRKVDPAEIRWMRGVLREGDVVLDVGAYKGGYTYWMRRAVGDAGTVIAFEPQPEPAAYLRRCVHAFGWRNVTIVEGGLSSQRSERTLYVPGDRPSRCASLVGASLPEGSRGYDVHVDALDRFLSEQRPDARVDFIKCDVEGHELDVFRGGRETLRGHRPAILFECEARHVPDGPIEDVFHYLHELGYRGFFFWRGEEMDVGEFDVRRHQVEGRRPHANNFVFVPASE